MGYGYGGFGSGNGSGVGNVCANSGAVQTARIRTRNASQGLGFIGSSGVIVRKPAYSRRIFAVRQHLLGLLAEPASTRGPFSRSAPVVCSAKDPPMTSVAEQEPLVSSRSVADPVPVS